MLCKRDGEKAAKVRDVGLDVAQFKQLHQDIGGCVEEDRGEQRVRFLTQSAKEQRRKEHTESIGLVSKNKVCKRKEQTCYQVAPTERDTPDSAFGPDRVHAREHVTSIEKFFGQGHHQQLDQDELQEPKETLGKCRSPLGVALCTKAKVSIRERLFVALEQKRERTALHCELKGERKRATPTFEADLFCADGAFHPANPMCDVDVAIAAQDTFDRVLPSKCYDLILPF